jgi:hypothetical protein
MSSPEITQQLRHAFDVFATDPEGAIHLLHDLYAEDMIFEDPIQKIEGLHSFEELNRRLVKRSKAIRFEVSDAVGHGENIFITWKMLFEPRWGPRLTVDGVTHAKLKGEKNVHQRDYWDLLGSVIHSFPWMEPLYRKLIGRLG